MAGGFWMTQNKIVPGAYINFESVETPMTELGTRGIVTMPLALDWGDTMIELFSTDLLNGKSLPKIGYTAFDVEEGLIFREALKSAYKACIYRLDTGGVKATLTLTTLTCTAKYFGVAGNKISVAVIANGSKFDVVTFFRGLETDRQTVATIGELVDNQYVDFSGTASAVPTASAGASLTGGTNGTVTTETAYPAYLAEISKKVFNTMGIPADEPTVVPSIAAFIKKRRDEQGDKCQAVVYNYAEADYEGIISSICGYENEKTGEVVSPVLFVATLAGMEAGAEITDSLTNTVIKGATKIINELDPDEIKDAITQGHVVLSKRQTGLIKITQDINTFTSFTSTKSYNFKKNKIVRIMDEVNNAVKKVWENGYEGIQDNDTDGRKTFKGDVAHLLGIMEGINALDNVDANADIEVQKGENSDAVYALVGAEPVDAMEKLYMLVKLR